VRLAPPSLPSTLFSLVVQLPGDAIAGLEVGRQAASFPHAAPLSLSFPDDLPLLTPRGSRSSSS
jgi:hypothetical protein